MALATKPWDPAEFLDSDEAVAAYIDAALDDGDPALVAAALGDVARARGMSRIADETGCPSKTSPLQQKRNSNRAARSGQAGAACRLFRPAGEAFRVADPHRLGVEADPAAVGEFGECFVDRFSGRPDQLCDLFLCQLVGDA